MKYTNELKKIGLTEDQSRVYEALLNSPLLSASGISKVSHIGREMTYLILGQLIEKDLIEKVDSFKVAMFRARHPRSISKFVEEKKISHDEALVSYEKIIENMISEFSILHNKPHVRFFEGFDGLRETYAEILKEAKRVFVYRSVFDYENKKIREI